MQNDTETIKPAKETDFTLTPHQIRFIQNHRALFTAIAIFNAWSQELNNLQELTTSKQTPKTSQPSYHTLYTILYEKKLTALHQMTLGEIKKDPQQYDSLFFTAAKLSPQIENADPLINLRATLSKILTTISTQERFLKNKYHLSEWKAIVTTIYTHSLPGQILLNIPNITQSAKSKNIPNLLFFTLLSAMHAYYWHHHFKDTHSPLNQSLLLFINPFSISKLISHHCLTKWASSLAAAHQDNAILLTRHAPMINGLLTVACCIGALMMSSQPELFPTALITGLTILSSLLTQLLSNSQSPWVHPIAQFSLTLMFQWLWDRLTPHTTSDTLESTAQIQWAKEKLGNTCNHTMRHQYRSLMIRYHPDKHPMDYSSDFAEKISALAVVKNQICNQN